MLIRRATMADVEAANAIYDEARIYMRENGNPYQWGGLYPGRADIINGITDGTSYVCEDGGEIVATFYFGIGADPTYATIYEGAWRSDAPYAAVHRIAVKYHGRGIPAFIFNECYKMHPNLRIDTHETNLPMQKVLLRCGFEYCGIIHLADGSPRMAYQRL